MDTSARLRQLQAEARLRQTVRQALALNLDDERMRQAAYDMIARSTIENSLETHVIVTCVCGRKNRIDKARAIVLAAFPVCGACKVPLPLRLHETTQR